MPADRSSPVTAPPPAADTMTVVRLEVDSFKRLSAAHVSPSPTGLVPVRGRNAQGKCLSGSTVVHVDGVGEIPISEFVRRRLTKLLGFEDGKIVSVPAVDWHSLGPKPMVRLSCRGHILDCAETHPVLTDSGWQRASEVSLGDHVAFARRLNVRGCFKITDDRLRLAGYMIGDGTMLTSCFLCAKKTWKVQGFMDAIKAVWPSLEVTSKHGQIYPLMGRKGPNGRVNPLREFVEELGIAHGSRVKNLGRLVGIPTSQVPVLLAALWFTDGYVAEGAKEVSYSTASEILAGQVARLLLRIGVRSTVNMRRINGLDYFNILVIASCVAHFSAELPLTGPKGIRLRSTRPVSHSQADVLPYGVWRRHDLDLRSSSAWHVDRRGMNRLKFADLGGDVSLLNDLWWVKVTGIEARPEELCFDVTVDTNEHAYVAAGMVVHNSSLIEAMISALLGGRAAPELPITEGAHGAHVILDLGALVVERRWKRDSGGAAKTSLVVRGADGVKKQGPQALLDSLTGRFADPVAFLEMKPDEQVKTVLGVLGLDEQLEALEETAAGQYELRREVGREFDRLKKAVERLAEEAGDLPPIPTESLEDLTTELQGAKDHNAGRDATAEAVLNAEVRGKEAAARLKELREEIAVVEGQVVDHRAAWTAKAEELNAIGSPVAVEPILEKMRAHEAAQEARAKREIHGRAEHDARTAEEQHELAEAALEETRGKIRAMLAGVEFPIDGMAYDPETRKITIGGIPFSQASQSERLRAAAAVAMAGSPTIRVMFAKEGSLLDDESRAQLAELAEAAGWQLWLEVVDSNPEGAGVWIEDGLCREA